MDVVVEQIVKKERSSSDLLKITGIIICTVAFVISLFVIAGNFSQLSIIFTIAAVSAFYGCYYMITGLNIEYEYILVNDELDIDKIIAKRKRQRILSIKIKDFNSFGIFNENNHLSEPYTSRVYACSGPNAEKLHYATFEHSKYGHTLLVFNPEIRIEEHIKKILPKAKQNDNK